MNRRGAVVFIALLLCGRTIFGAPLVFAGRAPAPIAEDERLRRVDRVVAGLKQAAAYADGYRRYRRAFDALEPTFEPDGRLR